MERLETRIEMLKNHLAELDVDDERRAEEIRTLDVEIAAFENERVELAATLEMLTEQSRVARQE